jgi:hypothetical protein
MELTAKQEKYGLSSPIIKKINSVRISILLFVLVVQATLSISAQGEALVYSTCFNGDSITYSGESCEHLWDWHFHAWCPPCHDPYGTLYWYCCEDSEDCDECMSGSPNQDSDGDGVNNLDDGCPCDPYKQEPGCNGCGVPDTDTDGDGIPDCIDGCIDDPNKVCGCDESDVDTDNDGTPDCFDLCPDDPYKIEPGVCGCNVLDIDSDGDGVFDCIDNCLNDPNYICDCNMPDVDTDGDGVPDCIDGCPEDPYKVSPGYCGCGETDLDADLDGVPNCLDLCPFDSDKIEPGICGCGEPETDTDGDGTPDCIDECPDDPGKVNPGICGCGVPDDDSDSDGTPDCVDLCPNDANKTEPGFCGCNYPETDSDNDGTPDCIDNCPADPCKVDPGVCGCGEPETDSDGDGTPDCIDECPDNPNRICGCNDGDIDKDKLGDSCDDDRDGDGCLNWIDNCPNDYNPVHCAEEDDDCITNEKELHTIIDWWLTDPWSYSEVNGVVVFEAEHYSKNHLGKGPAVGSMWLRGKDPNASSGQYMDALPDRDLNLGRNYIELYSPYLEYEVNFVTPSTYYLWAKGAAVDDRADTIWLGINGQLLHNVLLYSGVNFGWLSELFGTGMRPTVFIPQKGVYQVTIWMDDDGAKLDQFVLAVDANYVPSDPNETFGFSSERQIADYNRDGNIDLIDFAVLAQYWLKGTNPP